VVWYQTEMELKSTIKKYSSQNGSNPRRTRSATASNVFNVPNKSVAERDFCTENHRPITTAGKLNKQEKSLRTKTIVFL
jgi:hypothetical protein